MPDNKFADEAMVAFYVPDELAGRLAISSLVGGEKPDHLHITLVYLGKVDELNREAIGTVMQLWATNQKPISGDISGLARFAPESDGKEPFVALFDSPELPAARQSLMELLAPFICAEQTHGFTPHITLAYLEPGASAPLDQVEREEVTFTEVALAFGNEVMSYVLAGRTAEMIKHDGDKWILYSHDGSKKLGEFDTEEAAKKREREIQYFKHKGETQDGEGRATEKTHSEAWHRCVDGIKANPKQSGYNPYAVCTASLKEPGGADVYEGILQHRREAILTLTLNEAMAADKALAEQMKGRGVVALQINTDTWEITEVFASAQQGESARRSREYCESAIVAAGSGPEFAGHEWDVTIIGPEKASDLVTVAGREYVRSKNGRYYACEALAASLPLWEGIKVYDNHLTDAEFEARQGMRSVASEWIGTLTHPRWEQNTKRLCAHLKIVDETLAHKLKAGWDGGVLNSVGLSIDTVPETREALIEGKRVPVFEGFKRIFSVDLVAEPAAGGRFNRLIQSVVQEATMELTPEVIELIKAEVARALAGNQAQEQDQAPVETPEEAAAEVGDVAQQAATDVAAAAPAQAQPAEIAQQAADAAAQAAQAKADEIEQTVKALECRIMLKNKLDTAKMAESLRKLVEQQFAGRVFKEAQLDTFIKHLKEAVAPLDASGQVSGLGTGRSGISVGLTPQDKAQIEFMRLVAGNEAFRALEASQVPYVRERVPEAYQGWIKAGRPNYGTRRLSEWVYHLLDGDPLANQRAYEAITTSSMSSIVKNTVNILLAANYSKRHEWWQPIVRTEEVDTIDDATLARVYGLNSLSIVEEGQAYTELPWVDEEETASFVKKGNYVGITLETLLKDKLNVVRSLPDRLATSWYNTLSALVSGVFTVNTAAGPQLADGGALFNASAVSGAGGHANLLTAALSLTAYSAARTAMMKQTDQILGAGQKLLIEPKFLLVPADLETTALQIRNSEQIPGSANNDINPFYQKFEPIVVPNWTDTADWALVADPNEFPAIWLIFLTGKRVPELFTADSETQGAMFTNDTLRYKVRMLSYRFSATYECSPVADFRPVHKSNV